MKKLFFTISMVALFGLCANAQDDKKASDNGSVKTHKNMGDVQHQQGQTGDKKATDESNKNQDVKKQDVKKDNSSMQKDGNAENNSNEQKSTKQGTRMAITEKGVPASKTKSTTEQKPATTDQKAQPAKGDKH